MSRARVLLGIVVLLAAACNGAVDETATPTPDPGAPTPFVPTLGADDELTWRTGAEMPTPRTEVAATRVATRAYVAGGFTADGTTSDIVESYGPLSDRWETHTPLPTAVHHAALVGMAGRLYVIGGYRADGSASDEVWAMPPDGQAWEQRAPLPVARGAMAAVAVNGRIHVVGGATGFGRGARLSDAHHVYDPGADAWSQAPPLPDARDHLAAAAVGGKLYVVGGRKLSLDSVTARMDVFDTETGEWSQGPDMPTARGGLAAAEWRQVVVVVGGEVSTGTFDEVELFDPATGEWRSAPPLPTARHGLGAVGFETEEFVVLGGGPRPGLTVSGATELLAVVE